MPKAPKSCANPLFFSWVQQFHDEKDYKKKGGPPRATGYENALRALGACTTKYEHPRELLALSGVGPTCVERLTEKLKEYCEKRGLDMPEFKKARAPRAKKPVVPRKKTMVQSDEDEECSPPAQPRLKKLRVKKSKAVEEEDNSDYDAQVAVPVVKGKVGRPARSTRSAKPVVEISDSE